MRFSPSKFVADACRRSFYDFFKEFWSLIAAETLVSNWHIPYICEELQTISERVFAGKPKEHDTIINCPPGSTKSSIISIAWHPWMWTRMPSLRFISGSYAERLALDLSRKSRDIVLSDKYRELFPGIDLIDDQNTKGYFVNSKGGMRYAVGVGGSVIGMHAHIIAIDDPIDPQGVLSDLILADANTWTNETLAYRKVDKILTPTVIIQQRLHQDDPSGHWLEEGYKVNHICLPADTTWEVKPESLKRFYKDGLFDPVRMPVSVLEEARKKLGEVGYAGQFGQAPVPRGGAMFHVNKLHFSGFCKTCGQHHSIPTQFKRGPIRYWDKAGCLLGDTIIGTAKGPIHIEDVNAGDKVLTRYGYEVVEWAGLSGLSNELSSVLFSNNSIVMGTWDHPVLTTNRYWVDLATLGEDDYVVCLQSDLQRGQEWQEQEIQTWKALSSREQGTQGSQGEGTSSRGIGIRSKRSMNTILCTEPFGDFTTVASPLASISTTLTRTTITIQLRILNASLEASICSGTGRNSERRLIENFCKKSVRRLLKQLLSDGLLLDSTTTFARSAVVSFVAAALIGNSQNTVTLNAENLIGVPVYDLTVSNQHEFFAEGVLVHNTQGGGAFTVGTKGAISPEQNVWVLDVVRGQWDSNTREGKILQTARVDTTRTRIWQEEEPARSGKEAAERSALMLARHGFHCRSDKVSGDKELRADTFSVEVNAGNVYLVTAPWNHEWIKEFRFFPRSKYKDQIDSGSGMYNMMTKPPLRIGGCRKELLLK
jgi:predicted phage terminase large subunit-like protein